MNLFKSKYVFGFFGTIFLGVISSALWDGIKPFSIFLYEKTLYISVLGVEKFKDGIYEDIAKGHHENVSLEIYVLINSAFLSIIIVTLLLYTLIYLYKNGDNHTAQKIVKVIKWPRSLSKRSFFVFIFFYAVFSLTVFSLNFVKTKYVNQAVTYYSQLVDITAPYVDDAEMEKIHSDFAQIKNKSDFVSVINNLKGVTQENDLNEPEFNFIF